MIKQTTRGTFNRALGAMIATAVMLPLLAHAQDHLTSYAKTKNGCGSGDLIVWSANSVSGTDFRCELGQRVSVGTGLDGYHNSRCSISGQQTSILVVFGLAVRPGQDHFGFTLEGHQSFDMYPCTAVADLIGTN